MQPPVRNNLTDGAADALRAEISAGRWPVGTRIPNEATLSEMLLVSRGTVREAVRFLVAQGLLETRQGSGTYVRATADPAAALDRVRRACLRDQWEARAALDAEAARLAALRRTPADIERMRRLLGERGTAADGGREAFVRRDIAFHKAVVAASGNRAMMEIYDFFTAAIMDVIQSSLGGDLPEPGAEAHAAIVDAIAAGDPDKAVAAVRAFAAPALLELDRLISQ
ncbi:FadR/GntR family transcriptional regulator [Mesorhizobium sp. SP-1A]|uniref:FadR/GntR family transcriptional regulator n=1 Tax=Mesorhizobium sp. SP-1A TaxID=3077840 RepID=UPI0028F6F63B|nr:FCD domain-containing protein [Mesorhizobium sp. SP-1A]